MDMTAKDNWDATLYDGKHSFVSKYGNDLVDLLNPKKGERILDLGSDSPGSFQVSANIQPLWRK